MDTIKVLSLSFSLVVFLLVNGFISSLIVAESTNLLRSPYIAVRRKVLLFTASFFTICVLALSCFLVVNSVVDALKR